MYRGVIALVGALAVLAAGPVGPVSALSGTDPAAAVAGPQAFAAGDLEQCFLDRINAARASEGLTPVVRDPGLTPYLQGHSADMAAAATLFHSTSAEIDQVLPAEAGWWGENVGMWSAAGSCDAMHEWFMASQEGHRENILRPEARYVGIGVSVVGGTGWVALLLYEAPLPFTDIAGSPFAADIAAVFGAGITQGCSATQFCPDQPVTRGQMAAFLNRALNLPAGGTTPFTDIAASGFVPDISAVYSAGITQGCAADRYCPYAAVTRGQMAAFLNRALGLS